MAPAARPLFGKLDEDALPPMPCDLSRVYRGQLGTRRITLRLSRTDDTLQGYTHEDRDGSAVEVTGRLQEGAITLRDKAGGVFRAVCVVDTGALRGTYERRGAQTPFTLSARPAGEVAIHTLPEEMRVKSQVAAECRGLTATSLHFFRRDPEDPESDVMCPGPDATSEDRGDSFGDCVWSMVAPRVFGLGDTAVERAVNRLLSHDGQPHSAARVRAKAKRCELGQETSASGTFRLTFNAKEILSVLLFGEVSTWSGPEHLHVGPRGMTVDVQSGKRLELRDVVTDEKTFAEAAEACLPAWTKLRGKVARDRFFEDHETGREVLGWVVVPGGLAVVGVGYEDASAGLAGQGPILSFAGLLSRQMLRADSLAARLWADVKPGSSGAAICTSALGVDEIVAMP